MNVYLETGSKKTFAGAIDWPGWARGGRDEEGALQALVDYAPRYAHVLDGLKLGFKPPAGRDALTVVERLAGDTTTDFGAPGAVPSADARPVNDKELDRLLAVLDACWRAFDAAAAAAAGKELRTGPRGGGRDLDKITGHVVEAQAGYLGSLGWKLKREKGGDLAAMQAQVRDAIPQALAAAARGELPERGPRGGLRWTPRYFVRRSAWHLLDHAWEIEDRIT